MLPPCLKFRGQFHPCNLNRAVSTFFKQIRFAFGTARNQSQSKPKISFSLFLELLISPTPCQEACMCRYQGYSGKFLCRFHRCLMGHSRTEAHCNHRNDPLAWRYFSCNFAPNCRFHHEMAGNPDLTDMQRMISKDYHSYFYTTPRPALHRWYES